MRFALHRTRAELAIIVQRLRPYRKAIVAAVAPVVVAVVHDVTGVGVDLDLVEQALMAAVFGAAVYATPNTPKV
jgi:hypothetical protein